MTSYLPTEGMLRQVSDFAIPPGDVNISAASPGTPGLRCTTNTNRTAPTSTSGMVSLDFLCDWVSRESRVQVPLPVDNLAMDIKVLQEVLAARNIRYVFF